MVLAVFSAVLALVPAGFTENPVLNSRAAWITQKPVHIYCANDDTAWRGYIDASGAIPPNGIANGLTPVIGGDTTYLSPQTCAPILTRLRALTPSLLALGATLDILTHESLHLRGSADEGQTECDAIRVMPHFLAAKWGFRNGRPAFNRVMTGAWNYHRALPAQYRTVC